MSALATSDLRLGASRFASAQALRDGFALALLYAALAYAAIHLARQPGSIAAIWMADGAALAFLLTAPRSHWPALLAGLALGNVSANLAYGDPLSISVLFCLGNGATVLFGAWLVQRMNAASKPADGALALLRLLLPAAVIAPALGATFGAASLHAHGLGSFDSIWLDWTTGSVVGTVMTLPMVLAWRRAGLRGALTQIATPVFAALLPLTIAVALVALARLPYPFVYLVPVLVAGAFLTSALAALTLCFALGVTVACALAFGVLPLPVQGVGHGHLLVYTPALLGVLSAQLLVGGLARDRELSNMLASLSSGSTDLMLMFDLDGIVRAVNTAWLKSIGRTQDEVVGRHWTRAIARGVYNPGMQQRIDRALAGESLVSRVVVPFSRDERRTMDTSYQPTYGTDGQRTGVIWSVHDVSDLIAAQAQLQRRNDELHAANEELEQFARVAANDLREPLNTIVQFGELIQQNHGQRLDPAARSYLGQVRDGAARLRSMLDDMLQLARLGREPGVSLDAAVPLDEVLAQVRAALHARIFMRDAKLDIGALPVVRGHANLLLLLFQNLVSNALKFVPPERVPQVRVHALEAQAGDERVTVIVEDNGIGIDAHDVPKLFQPFTRLHSRHKFDGSGLGLAVCRRIAVTLEGEIAIDSTPGAGTRMRVTLKRA